MTKRVYLSPRCLDKRVWFDLRILTKGSSGGAVSVWIPSFKCWAKIERKSGQREDTTAQAGGESGTATHEVEIWYKEGIIPTSHRMRFRGVIYTILSVDNPFEQNQKLILQCQTGIASG